MSFFPISNSKITNFSEIIVPEGMYIWTLCNQLSQYLSDQGNGQYGEHYLCATPEEIAHINGTLYRKSMTDYHGDRLQWVLASYVEQGF